MQTPDRDQTARSRPEKPEEIPGSVLSRFVGSSKSTPTYRDVCRCAQQSTASSYRAHWHPFSCSSGRRIAGGMEACRGGYLMKQIVLTLLVSLALAAWPWTPLGAAQTTPLSPSVKSTNAKVNPHELRQMLNKGLKATRDNEKEYIDWVVTWVEKNKLPVSLVYASFHYSRARRPQYPFPYFVYSLETLISRNKLVLSDD
jgi:hypothetical protein